MRVRVEICEKETLHKNEVCTERGNNLYSIVFALKSKHEQCRRECKAKHSHCQELIQSLFLLLKRMVSKDVQRNFIEQCIIEYFKNTASWAYKEFSFPWVYWKRSISLNYLQRREKGFRKWKAGCSKFLMRKVLSANWAYQKEGTNHIIHPRNSLKDWGASIVVSVREYSNMTHPKRGLPQTLTEDDSINTEPWGFVEWWIILQVLGTMVAWKWRDELAGYKTKKCKEETKLICEKVSIQAVTKLLILIKQPCIGAWTWHN